MKKMSVTLLLLVIGLTIGITIENRLDISQTISNLGLDMEYDDQVMEDDSLKVKSDSKEKKILYWVAPMNPTYRRDESGKSPMGMDLVPVYEGGEEEMGEGMPIVKIKPEVVNNLGVRTITAVRGTI